MSAPSDSRGAVPRISVGLPQLVGETGPELILDHARRAEALGFAGLWTIDSDVGGPTSKAPLLDGLHALTFAAAVTQRVRLGIAVIVMPRRNPLLLAKELASIDRLSSGRLTVGVGLGGRDELAGSLGFPSGRRAGRLAEGVQVLRRTWSEQLASFQGDFVSFADLPLEPKPKQRPGPPIWFGASHPAALRRAARLGDGWIGGGSTASADFARQIPVLCEELAAAGRDEEPFVKAKRVYIAVESDRRLAVQRMTAVLDPMYGATGLTDRCALCGTVEECAEGLARLVELGAEELILNPLYSFPEQLESLAEVSRLLEAL